MANRNFSQRVEKIEVSEIKQMPLLARSVPGAISLGQGIPSLSTPKYIRRQVADWLESEGQIGKYSLQPGMGELKELVAKQSAAKCGREVDPETEVFISTGAMEALFSAIVSIVDNDDEVILFDPGYSSHIEQVVFAGGKPVFVPLEEESGWKLNRQDLSRAVTGKTKAIVVCSPSNPTGKVFSSAELEIIVEIAKESGIYLIADETYDFLLYDGAAFTSLTSFNEIRDQTIACYSFSKQFAMTGWRVGYMYAPAAVINQALKVHDAAVICAPTISQYAALAALSGTPAEDENIVDVLSKRRNLICSRLDALNDLFSYVKPQGAYYIFPKYLKTGLNSKEFAVKVLNQAKVITIPGRAFGPKGEGHIRLSYGGTEDEINQAFDRIEKWNKTI